VKTLLRVTETLKNLVVAHPERGATPLTQRAVSATVLKWGKRSKEEVEAQPELG